MNPTKWKRNIGTILFGWLSGSSLAAALITFSGAQHSIRYYVCMVIFMSLAGTLIRIPAAFGKSWFD